MVRGSFFDGTSSRRIPSTLEITRDGFVRVHGTAVERFMPLSVIELSPRIAHAPRQVHFPDGAAFETLDGAALDAALGFRAAALPEIVAAGFERRLYLMALAVLVLAGVAWWLVREGIPGRAGRVATALPAAASVSLHR